MKKKKAFTLIELIAVLVILAILALIVTPLVMNIIKKARISADKRSIDAYGRSIELAIASYLLDEGKFPSSINELTIEYSGDEVVCSTTQLNGDSSVYLTGCTVAGRIVDYTYGSDKTLSAPTYTAYSVGDYISYNGINYYVIEDSDTTNDTVKILKENPLTKTEMDSLNLTGIYISEENGYGKVQYGSSADYSISTVKQVVDAWATTAVKSGDSVVARIIELEELLTNLGYDLSITSGGAGKYPEATENVPTWVYNSNYDYWTMTASESGRIWQVSHLNWLTTDYDTYNIIQPARSIRPVLELNKSASITKLYS